jgi:glycosyltransferase involved in cell wall biosynthesis
MARKPSICLCMIVKDEAGVIERCLRSVLGLIDRWVICDTGSTDGTQELVRSSLEEIDGDLHQRPWVDFGHNRTEVMELARGTADYLLLLDADMTVTYDEAGLHDLAADSYSSGMRTSPSTGSSASCGVIAAGSTSESHTST